MASRTTVYCSDETETKLQELLARAKTDPVGWSVRTGKPAPANMNQLFALLVELGHDLIKASQAPEMLAEIDARWSIHLHQDSDTFQAPPLEMELYIHLLDAKRADSIRRYRTCWRHGV